MKKQPFLIAAVALLFSGCGNDFPAAVDVCKYEKQEIFNQVILNGSLIAADEDQIIETKLTDCKVNDVRVKPGTTVRQGDVICTFDTAELEARIAALQKQISSDDEQQALELQEYEDALRYAKDSMSLALDTLQNKINVQQRKYELLCAEQNELTAQQDTLSGYAAEVSNQINEAGTTEDIEKLQQDYASYAEQIAELEQQIAKYDGDISAAYEKLQELQADYRSEQHSYQHKVDTAQAELEREQRKQNSGNNEKLKQLQEMAEQSVLRAPTDGTITAVHAAVGRYCSDGAAAELMTADNLQIRLSIPDANILSVHEGDAVSFTTSANDHVDYSGTVAHINPIRGADGYESLIDLETAESLRIGMTAAVTFRLDLITVPSVPNAALASDANGQPLVYKLTAAENGKYTVHVVPVKLGTSGNTYTAVQSPELAENDMIVLNPKSLTEGETVTPSEPKEQS